MQHPKFGIPNSMLDDDHRKVTFGGYNYYRRLMDICWNPSFGMMILIIIILTTMTWSNVKGQRADIEIPPNLGCILVRNDLKIVCTNTTIKNVLRSTKELVLSVNDPIQPIHIEITNSSITRLPKIFPRFNRTLKLVKVKHNALRYVHPDAFANMGRTLVHLDLSWNMLVSLPFALRNLTSLEYLDLSHNQIFVVDGNNVFKSPLNLLTLDLSHNALGLAGAIPEEHETGVKSAYPVRDRIAEKYFSFGDAVNSLQYLDVSNSQLARLPETFTLRQLPYLRVLKMSNNSISVYPDALKRLLPRLQKLYMDNNRISWIPSFGLQEGLTYIDYTGNPLQCVCDTLRLREFLQGHNTISNLPPCSGPKSVRGSLVWDLPDTLCHAVSTTEIIITTTEAPTEVITTTEAPTEVTTTTTASESLTEVTTTTEAPTEVTTTTASESLTEVTTTATSEKFIEVITSTKRVQPSTTPSTTTTQIPVTPEEETTTEEPTTRATARKSPLTSSPSRHELRMIPKTRLINVTSGTDEIKLIWQVDYQIVEENGGDTVTPGIDIHWYAQYRIYGQSNKTTLKISTEVPEEHGNHTYEYLIDDLMQATGYIICFINGDRLSKIEGRYGPIRSTMFLPPYCQEVTTLGEKEFPVVEVAVATTVSTSTTMAIVAVFCFCCPKRFWKKKKKEETVDCNSNSNKHKLYETKDSSKCTNVINDRLHYIDHNDLLLSRSNPELAPDKTVVDNTIAEQYLIPIRYSKPKYPHDTLNNVHFNATYRMDGYRNNKTREERKCRPYLLRQNTKQGQSDSDSDVDVDCSKYNKNRRRYNWQHKEESSINLTRPLSADNVSPSASTSSRTEMQTYTGKFVFPRVYTTYK